MKNKIQIASLFLLTILLVNCESNSNSEIKTITTNVKTFFTEYLTLNKSDNPQKWIKLQEQYCTESFIAYQMAIDSECTLEETPDIVPYFGDGDWVLCGQELGDKIIIKSVTLIDDARAYVIVQTTQSKNSDQVMTNSYVTLIKKETHWLIEHINC